MEDDEKKRQRPREDGWTTKVFFALVAFSFLFVVASIFSKVSPDSQAVVKGSLEAVSRAAAERQAYTVRALEEQNSFDREAVLVAAHRGCHERFPENSLGAIAACAEEGAQLAEVDLQVSADGEVVLVHDESPARVALAPAASSVASSGLDELRRLWLGGGPFKIPTLAEAIEVAAACGIVLLLDPKQRELERRVADVVERAGAWDSVLFGHGFDPHALRAAAARRPDDAALRFALRFESRGAAKAACADGLCNSTRRDRPVAWSPTTAEARRDFAAQCHLRRAGRGTAFTFLAENGENHVRDPETVRALWNLTAEARDAALSHGEAPPLKPCPTAHLHEFACFGAHLYIPLLQASCARIALTDMPSALRAALRAFDLAPAFASATSVAAGRPAPLAWPLDAPKLSAHPNIAHTLPASPKCLELVIGPNGEDAHYVHGDARSSSLHQAIRDKDLATRLFPI